MPQASPSMSSLKPPENATEAEGSQSNTSIPTLQFQGLSASSSTSNAPAITAPVSQRILNPEDQLIGAVANWNGAKGRFVLRKKGSVSRLVSG